MDSFLQWVVLNCMNMNMLLPIPCVELEEESPIINWSLELATRLDSRLYALWNRTAGDCLLDSVLQATWGIYDKDSVLRKALHDSLHDCSHWWAGVLPCVKPGILLLNHFLILLGYFSPVTFTLEAMGKTLVLHIETRETFCWLLYLYAELLNRYFWS